MDLPVIAPLVEVLSWPVSEVGELSKQLAQIATHQLPVPASLVVPVSGLQTTAEKTGLEEYSHQLSSSLDWQDEHAVQVGLSQLRKRIHALHIPSELSHPLQKWYHQLRQGQFVRLQLVPITPDVTTRQLTLENIHGESNIVESLLELWAANVQANAAAKSFDFLPGALLIQHQPQPTASGIVHLHPQQKSQVHIESVWGVYHVHPELLPDTLVVDVRTHTVIQRQNNPQYLRWERHADKLVSKTVLHYQQLESSLTDAQAVQLAELAFSVKQALFHRYLLEWMLVDGQLLLNNITAIPEAALTKHLPSATGRVLIKGIGLQPGVATGNCRVISTPQDTRRVQVGDILVFQELTPQLWPLLKRAVGLIIESGLPSPQALAQLQNLHLPTIIKATNAITTLQDGQEVTINGATGLILSPTTTPHHQDQKTSAAVPTITKLYISAGDKQHASTYVTPLVDGVGVLRSEYTFIQQGEHPQHLIRSRKRGWLKKALSQTVTAYQTARPGLPVLYRSLNLTSGELSFLSHSASYEPSEPNPYLGFRGGIRIISDFSLFDLELEVLTGILREKHSPLGLLLPFVRTPHELLVITSHIQNKGLFSFPHFGLWLQLNTPENVLQLDQYLRAPLSGVSLNISTLHSLLHGLDPDNPDLSLLYTYDYALLENFIKHVVTTVQQTPTSSLGKGTAPQVFVHLETVDHRLVEIATQLGVDGITVKPAFAPAAKHLIRQVEEARLH